MYSGPGLQNPHLFGAAAYISCTGCHGGNGTPGVDADAAHVPEPPVLQENATGYVARRSLVGLDLVPSWQVDGVEYTGLDYLQFRNPGDTRVVAAQRGCGNANCHGDEHGAWVTTSPMATNAGIFSKARFAIGSANANGVVDYQDTAADFAFRPITDPYFTVDGGAVDGRVESLLAFPETGARADDVHRDVLAGDLTADLVDQQVVQGSSLEALVTVAIGSACGDCHLGSAGVDETYGTFRSSGCSACHMPPELDGQSRTHDPNVSRLEPANPDGLVFAERPHVGRHRIRSVARDRPGACSVTLGIDDAACASCHVGSNQTALQYWGVRSDPNRDVARGVQYPANPITHADATNDPRFFDPAVNNATYAGFTADQLLVNEDYDGDGRDDTPPDVHYEAGMACIDCHGSFDVHGGTAGGPTLGIRSQQHQATSVRCVSCHGDADATPALVNCVDYRGHAAECPVDRLGNPVRNVTAVSVDGEQFLRLRGRVSGRTHWVPLVRDLVDATSARVHPATGQPLYSEAAAFAMGRVGSTGGPVQAEPTLAAEGFAHGDVVDCEACHTAWTNSRYGNHLQLAYDPSTTAHSPITGEQSTFVTTSGFAYQTPIVRSLVVEVDAKIGTGQPGNQLFFRYTDRAGAASDVFTFSDRAGFGNLAGAASPFPALASDRIMAHSTRGASTPTNEGVMGCPACHLTAAGLEGDFNDDGFTNREDYEQFRARFLDGNRPDDLNLPVDPAGDGDSMFEVLQEVIGSNPGNQANHPLFVAMNAGLGTGLFLFDADGCALNALDQDAYRLGCAGNAPSDNFEGSLARYDLDRLVERSGTENVSMTKPMADGQPAPLRVGSQAPSRSGPLGASVLERLTDPEVGIVLDHWTDADGVLRPAP